MAVANESRYGELNGSAAVLCNFDLGVQREHTLWMMPAECKCLMPHSIW